MAARAELRGRLSLNDALFHVGLKRAGAAVKSFASSTIGQLSGVAAGFFGIRAFTGAVGVGDELYKLSRRTGVGVQSLAALREIAVETNTEMGSLAGGINKMQRSLILATRNPKGPQDSAIRLLKLDAQELLALRPERQFQEIGAAIARLPNPALRTAVAMQLFGRSGAELLPIFDQIGSANFGNLDAKAKILAENAKDFHEIAVLFRAAGENLQSFFVGFAAGFKPILDVIGAFGSKNPFAEWGKAFGSFLTTFVEFEAGIWGFVKDFFTALIGGIQKAFAGLSGPLAAILGPLKSFFQEIWNAIKSITGGIVKRGKKALGVQDESPTVEPVSVEGYSSPLESGHDVQGGSLIPKLSGDAWRAQFRPKFGGKNPLSFGGPMSKDAFGQRGGLGSMAKWDTKAIMGLGSEELLKTLFSEQERQGITNQVVAAGGERPTTSPYAYGAVASGDQQRRTAYIREQVRAKTGVDKSNEILQSSQAILQSIDQSTGELVDELSD